MHKSKSLIEGAQSKNNDPLARAIEQQLNQPQEQGRSQSQNLIIAKSDQHKYQAMIKKTNEADQKMSARRIGSVDFQKNLEKLNLDDTQKI